MLSRRAFLITTAASAAGLIVPSWLAQAKTFIDTFEEPLIEAPPHSQEMLYATDFGDGNYRFSLGDPWTEPPDLTWREYLDRYHYGMSLEEFYGVDSLKDLTHGYDDVVPDYTIMDAWIPNDSPDALAYRILESYDLGPAFGTGHSEGEIDFVRGPIPGSDATFVTVPDHLSLSLLQKRLNEVNSGLEIQLAVNPYV